MNVVLRPIESVHDPCLLPALRIYQESFPVYEQMSTVFWFETVLSLPQPDTHFQAIVDPQTDEALGMVFYRTLPPSEDDGPHKPVAFLWYICVRSDQRGNGLGGRIYRQLVQTLFHSGYAGMVFEVEKPEEAGRHSEEAGETAQRRIQWYRKNGARILQGINYHQTVDNGLPPTPMHVMVHTPHPVAPEEAYALACSGLEKALERSSELALS